MSCCKTPLGQAAFILVIIGAINWGLIGVGHFIGTPLNVVTMIVGTWPPVEAIIYILVGLAGVYKIIGCKK